MGTSSFGNDHFAAITGYGDYPLRQSHGYGTADSRIFNLKKRKKASHIPRLVPSSHSKLECVHMDLCGPMRMASINGKKYILVIVDDYSQFTWGIINNFSTARTPQQSGIVERHNRTLVEAARTMLMFSRLLEFLWAGLFLLLALPKIDQ
ncbi:retrovirus-related pol polyprotein from transposon TNT 1-94 [Tanacetum coccineum]